MDREGAGHPSILRALGSPKPYGYGYLDKDKLGEDKLEGAVLDIAKGDTKSASASASASPGASVESLVFAPVPIPVPVFVPVPVLLSPNRLEELDRGVRVLPGEAV